MSNALSQKQLELLWHTLGLCERVRVPYRNFYHASENHPDHDTLQELTVRGYMKIARRPGFLCEDAILFVATDNGITAATAALPAPSMKKLSKYDEYLHEDGHHSFSEYLGITLPELEHHRGMFRYTRRKMRLDYSVEVIQGEWATTQKAAKASYKTRLKAAKQNPQNAMALY